MADTDLCSLEEAKRFYDITTSKAEDDTLIEELIGRVSSLFHSYIGIDQIKSKVYTEYYDGDGTEYLFLDKVPVISVTSIHEDNDWTFGSDVLLDALTYRVANKRYITLKDDVFAPGTQNIKVVYTAGYAVVPEDIKQVCIEESIRRFKNRNNFDLVSKTMPDGSVNYSEKGLLRSTTDVLNKYKRVTVF
jgi:hypothetical protein